MDKINALKDRKSHLYSISSAVRENINKLTDEKSFVELDAFAFSHNAFYDTDIIKEQYKVIKQNGYSRSLITILSPIK